MPKNAEKNIESQKTKIEFSEQWLQNASFEELNEWIEKALEQLNTELPLEQSLLLYENASKTIARAQEILQNAQKRCEKLQIFEVK